MARAGRPLRRAAARGWCAAALALAASGCALVSTTGNVHQVNIPQGGSEQNQEQPQLIPTGPGKGWTPAEIVTGFLAASASFANDYAIARSFLTPSEAGAWHPNGSVTVVGDLGNISPVQNEPKRQPEQPSNKVTQVNVIGAQLATLTGAGQYLTTATAGKQPAGPQAKNKYTFTLVNAGNSWRISQLPTSQLMLTKDELERVYQQRNLYFLDPPGLLLVPDPVFVPQNDTVSDMATRLVTGLLGNPRGWLAGAARTAFPRGTRLVGPVRINGPNATVDLSVPAAAMTALTREQQAQLAAQLVWTLTSTSYGPAAIGLVAIEINGRTLTLNAGPYLQPKLYQDWVPSQAAASGPYFISRFGEVKELSLGKHAGPPRPGPGKVGAGPVAGQAGGSSVPPLSDIAVEPDEGSLAGLSQDRKTVYIGDLSRDAPLSGQRLGGIFTSLSWDRQGYLWVASASTVWMLLPGAGSQEINPKSIQPRDQLTDFRVAPDGVRVAMIVQVPGGGSQVLLAAITHTSRLEASIGDRVAIGAQISAPQDLTWYDADHLIVLTHPGAQAQLVEIPLNGGQPRPIATLPGTISVTSDGTELAVGLSNGNLAVSPGLDAPWQPVPMAGSSPAYPG